MKERIERIQSFFDSDVAPIVDITCENEFLNGLNISQSQNTVMITGMQDGDPLSLLEGLGLKDAFPESFAPQFPVECIYGEKLSFIAELNDGSKNVFYSGADLCRHFGDMWASVSTMTINIPSEVLKQTSLMFYVMNSEDNGWKKYASRCRGYILTLAADAGMPNEKIIGFCKWADAKLSRKEHICTVLNHAERTLFVNESLSYAMEELLGQETTVLTCDRDMPDEEGPEKVLNGAIATVLTGKAADFSASEKSVDDVLSAVELKLQKRRDEIDALVESSEAEKSKWEKAIEVVKNEIIQDHYKLANLISNSEKGKLNLEISEYTTHLYDSMPEMADELLRCSDDPKKDIGNLCGDYMEYALEDFMTALINELANETLVPRATKIFTSTQERLTLMLNDMPWDKLKADDGVQVETEFLNTLHMNLGHARTRLAEMLGRIAAWLTSAAMLKAQFDFLSFRIGKLAGELVSLLVTTITPKEAFVKDCLKSIREKMPPEQTSALMIKITEESLLPLIIRRLSEAYDRMVDEYINAMAECVNAFSQKTQKCRENISTIESVLNELQKL